MHDCLPNRKAFAPRSIRALTSSTTSSGLRHWTLFLMGSVQKEQPRSRGQPRPVSISTIRFASRGICLMNAAPLECQRLQLIVRVERERAKLVEVLRVGHLGPGPAASLRAPGQDRAGENLAERTPETGGRARRF